jgi:hypothetical protein
MDIYNSSIISSDKFKIYYVQAINGDLQSQSEIGFYYQHGHGIKQGKKK